ncbi:hypothetical protein ACWF0M_12745 [Kribbella sp. NPDC055110]
MPSSVVLFACDFKSLPGAANMLAQLRNSRLFWVPLAAFDGSLECALYALRLLLVTDFADMVARNRDLISLFASTTGPYVFNGPGTEMAFDLVGEETPIASRTRIVLSPGESTSLGFFTETGMSIGLSDMEMPYRVTGEFLAQGLLTARNRESPPELDSMFIKGAQAAESIRQECVPLKMIVEDNRLEPGCFGDLENVIGWSTNEEYDWMITELAFGTNASIRGSVDWSYNSQFNEGVGGMHIALGDGRTGIHIDFICPGGQLRAPDSGTISGFVA